MEFTWSIKWMDFEYSFLSTNLQMIDFDELYSWDSTANVCRSDINGERWSSWFDESIPAYFSCRISSCDLQINANLVVWSCLDRSLRNTPATPADDDSECRASRVDCYSGPCHVWDDSKPVDQLWLGFAACPPEGTSIVFQGRSDCLVPNGWF